MKTVRDYRHKSEHDNERVISIISTPSHPIVWGYIHHAKIAKK